MNPRSFSYDIGDLVFASHSKDMDWNCPWQIGRITEREDAFPFEVRIGGAVWWPHYVKIFQDTADLIGAAYRDRKGSVFIPLAAELMFAGSYKFDRTITFPDVSELKTPIDVDGMTIAQRNELIQLLNQANERENRRIFEGRAAIVSSWFDDIEEVRNFYLGYSDWVKSK